MTKEWKEYPQHETVELFEQMNKLEETQFSKKDDIKQPKHYKFFDTEAIKIIEASLTKEEFIGYLKGNGLKYRLRAGKKDNTLKDLAKAEEYERMYYDLIVKYAAVPF